MAVPGRHVPVQFGRRHGHGERADRVADVRTSTVVAAKPGVIRVVQSYQPSAFP
ncbi:hypothetical protein [Lentzea sp. HUAS12]|uniref:hypothetical protein n=1 Tax=Lentzea sp. HUAS12 TaxID=2951806 RepID=UPI00209E9DB5|nr:hypothetical protein [Lentzea sp. HUAS12]USX49372.1 hypothetical protein ND450_28505 [Lentzea sp. HUAS12]